MQAVETLQNVVGQQAQNQAAAATASAAATAAATTAANVDTDAVAAAAVVAAPTEVSPGNVVVERERPMHKLDEQFLKLNPPRFTGAGDLKATVLWIQDLEKAFALLSYTEEEKVVLAVYQLQGNASTWWRATRGVVFPECVILEWNALVEVFNGKYFSDSARELKMVEFQRLCQGTLTIDQYEAKFAELLQYTPRLIEDLVDQARRFRDGLRLELRSSLVPFNLKNYNDLYEWAQLIERDQNEQAATFGSRFGSNRMEIGLGRNL
ncbi:hypothetical protein ACJRO7_034123 [Eucalyptus globulus]|uniref:Retrotransposon gag domain-containing protein n=1 Tax=Eucalyptus globulus TaxID=34317 RepID=A0ABD3J5M5_EUCGL